MTRNGRAPALLIVDDDPAIRTILERFGRSEGCHVVACAGGVDAFEQLRRTPIDVALVDLQMPALDGIGVLRRIKDERPACEVVLMSGAAPVNSVVEAVKLGALDYLTKPLGYARLRELIRSVAAELDRRETLLAAGSALADQLRCEGMVGISPVMQRVFGLLRRLAPHARTALITGETGTGKELAARALHALGARRAQPLLTVNCSAITESLFESEVFGHARGAFTGAVASKPGLFEHADGRTLFLDEIGELTLPMQAKLLRVLETGEVQRVGDLQGRRVDVHVIAATNRRLETEIAAGRFRSDLFYRLALVQIALPPLRERREDIPYLAASFIQDIAGRLRKSITGMTPSAEQILLARPWPGNVRELRNALERACIVASGELLTETDMAWAMTDAGTGAPVEAVAPGAGPYADTAAERAAIVAALAAAQGSKAAAARLLGISRRAFYRRLERHGLADPLESRPPE